MFLLLLAITFFTAAWCVRKNFTYWKKYKNTVASVPGRVFSLSPMDFLKKTTNFGYNLKAIYDDPRFVNEPIVGIYGLYKPSLLIKEPEIIRSILTTDFHCFRNRLAEIDTHADPIGGNMLLLLRYDPWKEMRQKVVPFFSSAKIKHLYPEMQRLGKNMEDYLRRQNAVIAVEMKDFCNRYITDVIVCTMFGFRSNSVENVDDSVYSQVRKIALWSQIRTLQNLIIFFMPKLTSLFRSKFFFKETNEFLTYTFNHLMAERERTGEHRNDLFDIFVRMKHDAEKNGGDVCRVRELSLAQLAMMLAADFETTSTAMSNVFLLLAKNPDIQKRVRKEICQAFIDGKGDLSYEVITSMEYIDMIIYEALRLYPVLPVLDRVYSDPTAQKKSYSLQPYSDFSIPEGMPVYLSIYALNYDPKHWPNPKQFDPERFSPKNKETRHPAIVLPFGNGPHKCIGVRMGFMQIKSGLVYLMRNHYVRVYDKTVLDPEFDTMSFVLQVKGGINLQIVRDDMLDHAMKSGHI